MRGDRLRQVREQRGYTQEQLAEMLQIGNRQIWRYENGETDPASETVAQLARMLGVSADYLLGLNDDPIPRMVEGELSAMEKHVIYAWREGNRMEALKIIVNDK